MSALCNKRFLVIEDDSVNLAVISLVLRHYGAEVFEFNPFFQKLWADGTDNRLERILPIDVILTDLLLPNHLSGYDVFDQLHAIPILANIPVVAVSSHNGAQELTKARSKGFAGFISKPIRMESFERYLGDILSGKPIWMGSDLPH